MLWTSPARAARQAVDWSVEVGFDGVIPHRSGLFPVAITIDNKIAGTTGMIELSQPDATGNSEVRQTLAFESPAPSTKRFTMLARGAPGRDLELRIYFREYLRNIHEKLPTRDSPRPLVICAGVPRAFTSGAVSKKYNFVHLKAETLPADPLALDGLHAVMLGGSAFASLSRAQVAALRQWTTTGGRLILNAPENDQGFSRNSTLLLSGCPIDLHQPVAARFGAGAIASSGADPRPDRPFWENRLDFTDILFPDCKGGKDETVPGYASHASGLFTHLWVPRRAYGASGFIWIAVLVVIYIGVVGPFDRWLVRRLNRPALSWAIFAAAIVLFSLCAYAYSSFVNVGVMRTVCASVIDTADGLDTARGNAQLWIYSAKNGNYAIASSLTNACFTGRESQAGAGSLVAGVAIENGLRPSISARIPIFSSKEFDATWYMPWNRHAVCRKVGDDIEVTLPGELEIAGGAMANDRGLAIVAPSKTAAGATVLLFRPVEFRPWHNAVVDIASNMRMAWEYGGAYGGDDDARTMPTEMGIMNYLLYLSYQDKFSSTNRSDHNTQRFAYWRSFREQAMAAEKNTGGHTLLLFVKANSLPFPLSIEPSPAQSMNMALVRVHMPGLK